MTLTISLNEETEQRLLARAQERGLSIDSYVQDLVDREAASMQTIENSHRDLAQEFIEWADSFPDTPPLSDEAISRAALYPDRW